MKIYSHSEIKSTTQRQIYTSPHLCEKSRKISSPKMKSKSKTSTRKETIKIMAGINQVEEKSKRKITNTKYWLRKT
jgi:hypothetical protein